MYRQTQTHVYVCTYTGGKNQQNCETHQPATMKHNENSKNKDETRENGARTKNRTNVQTRETQHLQERERKLWRQNNELFIPSIFCYSKLVAANLMGRQN